MLLVVCGLLAAGATLPRPGWLSGSQNQAVEHTTKKVTAQAEDSLGTECGWRWRNGGVRHWRGCLLQQQ